MGSQCQNVLCFVLVVEWVSTLYFRRLRHLVLSLSGGWIEKAVERTPCRKEDSQSLFWPECLGLWDTAQEPKLSPRTRCQGELMTCKLVRLGWESYCSGSRGYLSGWWWPLSKKGYDYSLCLVFMNLSLLRKITECLMGSLRVSIGTQAGIFLNLEKAIFRSLWGTDMERRGCWSTVLGGHGPWGYQRAKTQILLG